MTIMKNNDKWKVESMDVFSFEEVETDDNAEDSIKEGDTT